MDDSNGGQVATRKLLTVDPVNDAPELVGTATSLPGGAEDTPYTLTKKQLLDGFSDADRDANGNQQALDITGLTATDADGNVVGSFSPISLNGQVDSTNATQGSSYSLDTAVLKDNVDGNGDPIAVQGLTINSDGSWSFNPATDTSLSVADGTTETITVNYNVTDDQGAATTSSFDITLTGTADGITPSATGATTSLVGDRWTFTPNANFNGTVKLNYNVTDGTAFTAASNSFDLASVNDIPALTGVQAVLANGKEDLEYTIKVADLLAGYTDADILNDANTTQALSIVSLSATNGVVTPNNDGTSYTFKPNADVNGTIDLNYVITDGAGGNAIASASFSLDAVNDKPIRTTGNVTTLYLQEDQDPASVGLTDLSYSVGGGSDESASQALSYALTNLPDSNLGQLGSLSTDTDGNSVFTAITEAGDISLEQLQQLVFNPAANAAGIASFSFSVTDQVKQPKITDMLIDPVPASYKSKSVAPMSGLSLPLQMMPMASGTGMTSRGFRSPRSRRR